MEITSPMLFYLLEKRYPVTFLSGSVGHTVLSGVRMLDRAPLVTSTELRSSEGYPLEPGMLYITDDPAALETTIQAAMNASPDLAGQGLSPSCAFLLVVPASAKVPLDRFSGADVACIRAGEPPVKILEHSFSLLIALQSWDLRLKDACFEAAGYDKLFKIVQEIFDLPFTLVDPNFIYVASTQDFFTVLHMPASLEKIPIEYINELLMDDGE